MAILHEPGRPVPKPQTLSRVPRTPRGWRGRTASLFILPALLLLAVFVVVPLGGAAVLSLTNWSGLGPMRFVGLSNYQRILTDAKFWSSVLRTAWYVLGIVLGGNLLGLGFALALFTRLRGWRVFRTVIYLSNVTPLVAMGILWAFVFNPIGPLNAVLGAFGLNTAGELWLGDPHLALLLVIFVGIWQSVGFPMLLYSAGLNRIPPEVLEAATLDSAGGVRRLWHVTLPILVPVMAMTTVMLAVSGVQVFATVWVMTGGGPGYATYVLGLYMYNTAFEYSRFGYANAMSVVVTVLAAVGMATLLRMLQRRLSAF